MSDIQPDADEIAFDEHFAVRDGQAHYISSAIEGGGDHIAGAVTDCGLRLMFDGIIRITGATGDPFCPRCEKGDGMGTFDLVRDEDATGVSGTGRVAQGVEFDDGTVVVRWLTEWRSTAIYANAADCERIHGHNGSTRLVWHTERKRGEER